MYLWLKAFHLVFVVTWFAGLFYLPRLFVYHAMAADVVSQDRFKLMERKLYLGIMMPSVVGVVIVGVAMICQLGLDWFRHATWLHLKLLLVAFLIAYQLYLGHLLNQFRADANRHSHVYYRVINELPVLILIVVILLAVLKPWTVIP